MSPRRKRTEKVQEPEVVEESEAVEEAPAPKRAQRKSKREEVSLSVLRVAAREDQHRRPAGPTEGASDAVKVVAQALCRLQYLPEEYAKDGTFGAVMVSAYSRWQRSLGYKGRLADGIPGKKSLEELGRRFGFDVVS